MDQLAAMRAFVRVVEVGTFTRAAQLLETPKPTVSKQIQLLEAHLRTRLLNRTTRRVTVTEIGQTYYQHCAALEAEAVAAQDAIDRTRSAPQGTVRLSCPISLMNGAVSPIIAKFLVANPLVRVFIDMTNRRVDVVEEGLDLAIRVRRMPLEPTNLAMRKLGESEGAVVGHPA